MRNFLTSLSLCALITAAPAGAADLEPADLESADLEAAADVSAHERVVPRLAVDLRAPWPSAESLQRAGYASGEAGTVIEVLLSVLVDEEGTVDRIGVYESNDPGEVYVRAALDAASTAVYHPGREGEKPQRMWTLLRFDFPSRD